MNGPRLLARVGISSLAAAMAWLALWSWNGLVEKPGLFLWPALLGAMLVVAVGSVGRTLRWPWYAVLATQLVVLVVWLDHRYAAAQAWANWVPTPASTSHVAGRIHDGAVAVNTYASPVSAGHAETFAYLLATSLLVIVSTDLLACGLRRVPWAGLPVIVTMTVPISVLDAGLSWPVFVGTAVLFTMLLATEETERVLSWGRSVAGRGERIDSLDQVVNGATVRGAAFRIGLLTAAGALVLPFLVPVSHGLFKGGKGPGNGPGDNSVVLRNPIVDLRRDLISQDHIPLVEARTTADPSYLRLTVLDQFDGVEWTPSARKLAKANNADGDLPVAPGQSPTMAGTQDRWTLRLDSGFDTSWLPTPYPTRTIDVKKGDWRYDLRTLDIAAVDKIDTAGLQYRLTGFTPQYSALQMQQAFTAPEQIRLPMTSVPGNRPSVVTKIAQEVTAGATTNYDKMVKLQNWFRNAGGFSYSLAPAAGSGIDQLVRFITVDRVGYCEQFAAAMAILARSLGVPARVAVGFLAPSQKRQDGTYVYTSNDLHAWPEIYFSGSGWVRFEPTPTTRTGQAPSWTLGAATPTQSTGPTSAAPSSSQSAGATRKRPDQVSAKGSSSSGSTQAVDWLVGLVLVLLLLALPGLIRTRQRRRRLGERHDALALADGVWDELCATARDLGIVLPLQRSVRDIAAVLRRRVPSRSEHARVLDELTSFVERARYARPFALDEATRAQVVAAAERWRAVLADSVPDRRSRFARVFPRSVLARETPVAVVDRPAEMVGATEVR